MSQVEAWAEVEGNLPRGSIYTTIMELGPKRPSPLWFWGPNSIIVVYMDLIYSRFPSSTLLPFFFLGSLVKTE